MSETIQDRVLRVIATTKRIPLENVRPDSTFEQLGVDSLDRLNILFDLESEFDVEINDEDAKKVSSIDEMVDGIALLVHAKEHSATLVDANRETALPQNPHENGISESDLPAKAKAQDDQA